MDELTDIQLALDVQSLIKRMMSSSLAPCFADLDNTEAILTGAFLFGAYLGAAAVKQGNAPEMVARIFRVVREDVGKDAL